MASLQPFLTSLLISLPRRPIDQNKLNEIVSKTLEDSSKKSSPETRKSQWEYLLKNEIFNLACTEGTALKDETTTYYRELRVRLDLVLTFTEHDACEQTFPFIVLQDLLEAQTIASCSHIFSWIEERASRLTESLVPQKGKALILLRTLNDLLRRLSKMGSNTIFCGRILTFLSGVFPLGERSGVNLRGEYGPTWEGVKYADRTKPDDEDVEMQADEPPEPSVSSEDKMQVDSKAVAPAQTAKEKKAEFYNTFWSLQLPFSKPSLFANKDTFNEFKESVSRVLPVIKEATAKERAMMGSRVGASASSLKRKRELDTEETNNNEYFFAKFLTSPDLLDLEVADTHFRRQFLFQLLILLNHLLTFTKGAKAVWSTPRNRSLQMEFILEVDDAQWVQETVNKVVEELRQTTPNGRPFAEAVGVILEREKNWVKWKNELCAPFDKEPWLAEVNEKKVGLLEATKSVREKMRDPPENWQWRLGTEPLTEIWDMGYRDLYDLQHPFQSGDVKDFVKKIKQEDARIELRKKTLTKTAERLAQAQAKAAAAKAATLVPPTNDNKEPSPAASKDSPMDVSSTAPHSPRPVNGPASGSASSPLHPSLPPKPGSPIKPPSSSQESGKILPPTSPAPGPAPAPAPVVVVTPPSASMPSAVGSVPVPAPITDKEIIKFEENKQRWAWLALRTARDQYLQHFSKIGTGDIELLALEIEKEKQEREKIPKGEEMPGAVNEEHGSSSPMPPTISEVQTGEVVPKSESNGDAKMES